MPADPLYSTARWRRLRAAKLARDPLCEPCKAIGRIVAASVVDHRPAISDGGDPFPPLDKLTSCCPPCHNAKTARGPEAGAVKTTRPRKGCNPDGSPLDPDHPWNRGDIKLRESETKNTTLRPKSSISFDLTRRRNNG